MSILSAIDVAVAAQSSGTPWLLVTISIAILILIALVAVKFGVVVRRREARWTNAADELGLHYQPKGDKAFRQNWSVLPEVKKTGSVKHVLTGNVQGFDVTAFEHTLMLMVGNAPIVIKHSICTTPAAGWPEVHITGRGWWSRWCYRRGARKGLLIGNEEFDLRRVVKANTPEFAQWLLSPEMRAFLLEVDGETWRVVGEQLCLLRRQGMRPGSAAFAIDRLLSFWSAIPQWDEDAAETIRPATSTA